MSNGIESKLQSPSKKPKQPDKKIPQSLKLRGYSKTFLSKKGQSILFHNATGTNPPYKTVHLLRFGENARRKKSFAPEAFFIPSGYCANRIPGDRAIPTTSARHANPRPVSQHGCKAGSRCSENLYRAAHYKAHRSF